MLKLICVGRRCLPTNSIRPGTFSRIQKLFSDDSHLLIGGGLEKFQGSLKEESYFRTQNYDLITKIREQGTQLKCENCLSDWTEFEKVLDASPTPTALRETCSLNKHKNCCEEAFFMNEQSECSKLVKEKLLSDSINLENQTDDNETTTFQQQETMKIKGSEINNE